MVKSVLFAIAILGGLSAYALDLSLSVWTSRCVEVDPSKSLNCGIPIKVIRPDDVQTLPTSELAPNQVKHHILPVQTIKTSDGDLKYELRIWEVYPKVGLRYYQVQLEWISPARATCMLSVDASKTQWSPMTCVSFDASSGVRYGLLMQTKL